MILDGYRYIVQTLQDAGIPAVDDPRNLTPGGVLVDPPSVTLQSSNLARLDVTATVVMPGPGNKDATTALIALVDKVAALGLNVQSAQPTTYSINGNDLPAYQINIQLQLRR